MHSWQIIVSQFTMAPRRDSSTMTRPTSGVILPAGDPSKREEDKNEIRDYIKTTKTFLKALHYIFWQE
jgi:hypothetical protein